MPQPKFKVGDVVAYNDAAGHLLLKYVKDSNKTRARVKLGCRGSIVTFRENNLDVGEFYCIEWFGGNGSSLNEVMELNLCKGIKNPHLCDKCKYRFECWTIRRK